LHLTVVALFKTKRKQRIRHGRVERGSAAHHIDGIALIPLPQISGRYVLLPLTFSVFISPARSSFRRYQSAQLGFALTSTHICFRHIPGLLWISENMVLRSSFDRILFGSA